MCRLVEADIPTAGQPDCGDRAPPCLLHRRAPDALLCKSRHLGTEIVTHEIELGGTVLARMDGHLCRREGEDQPVVARIHGGEPEHVPEESAVCDRVPAVDDHMGTKDHHCLLSLW